MAALERILDLIRDTEEQIALLEDHFKQHQDDFATELSLTSLRLMQKQLVIELETIAEVERVPICRYRIFKNDLSVISINAVGQALTKFQHLFTTVYAAIEQGPKVRATVPFSMAKLTEFGFGYTFAGSVGVVMTLPPSEAMLEARFEPAMKSLIELTAARSSDAVEYFSKELGPAPIRCLYAWADSHIRGETGVEIHWRDSHSDPQYVSLNLGELKELARAINEVSDSESSHIEVYGSLVAASLKNHSFVLEDDDGAYLSGKMAQAISESFVLELPKRYLARILRTTVFSYADDEQKVTYFLEDLQQA